MVEPGIESLLPTLVVVITAIVLRRALDALIIGTIAGFIMLAGFGFVPAFLDGVILTMGDETIRWIILTVSLFGCIVALLVRSGGAEAFANTLIRRIKSGSQALFISWCMGLAIFIDDYLNALVVGNSMRRVTDKFKVSREMLAYVVDTTAAPVCILLPFSTWAIYVSGLLESNQIAESGEGVKAYISIIPYMFYAMIAVVMPLLVLTRKIPLLGQMRAAEQLAQTREFVESNAETAHVSTEAHLLPPTLKEKTPGKAIHFILPILTLVFFTWFFDIDILRGAFVTLLLLIVFFRQQGLMSFMEISETILSGIKDMVEVIGILLMSFVLRDINDQLQLTQYVIGIVTTFVHPVVLPMVTFIALSSVAFATGSFWGLYAIALPIVIPLAQAVGIDTHLMIGAVVSAGAFGSHACFYSDSTLLSAQGSGCSPMQHALTQLPYAVLAAALAALGYLAMGFMM